MKDALSELRYIYSEADYAEQGSEPVKILGKNMLMQVVPTDYQAIGHGNVLKEEIAIVTLLGWKIRRTAAEEGMYYAVVNAAGAVEGSRRAAVYVKAPVPEETEPGLRQIHKNHRNRKRKK